MKLKEKLIIGFAPHKIINGKERDNNYFNVGERRIAFQILQAFEHLEKGEEGKGGEVEMQIIFFCIYSLLPFHLFV